MKSSISCGCSPCLMTPEAIDHQKIRFVTEHDFTSQKLDSMLRKVEASRSWEFHKFWNLGVFWGAQPSKVGDFYGMSSFKKLKHHTCTIHGESSPNCWQESGEFTLEKWGAVASSLRRRNATFRKAVFLNVYSSVLCWSSWTPITLNVIIISQY